MFCRGHVLLLCTLESRHFTAQKQHPKHSSVTMVKWEKLKPWPHEIDFLDSDPSVLSRDELLTVSGFTIFICNVKTNARREWRKFRPGGILDRYGHYEYRWSDKKLFPKLTAAVLHKNAVYGLLPRPDVFQSKTMNMKTCQLLRIDLQHKKPEILIESLTYGYKRRRDTSMVIAGDEIHIFMPHNKGHTIYSVADRKVQTIDLDFAFEDFGVMYIPSMRSILAVNWSIRYPNSMQWRLYCLQSRKWRRILLEIQSSNRFSWLNGYDIPMVHTMDEEFVIIFIPATRNFGGNRGGKYPIHILELQTLRLFESQITWRYSPDPRIIIMNEFVCKGNSLVIDLIVSYWIRKDLNGERIVPDDIIQLIHGMCSNEYVYLFQGDTLTHGNGRFRGLRNHCRISVDEILRNKKRLR